MVITVKNCAGCGDFPDPDAQCMDSYTNVYNSVDNVMSVHMVLYVEVIQWMFTNTMVSVLPYVLNKELIKKEI